MEVFYNQNKVIDDIHPDNFGFKDSGNTIELCIYGKHKNIRCLKTESMVVVNEFNKN